MADQGGPCPSRAQRRKRPRRMLRWAASAARTTPPVTQEARWRRKCEMLGDECDRLGDELSDARLRLRGPKSLLSAAKLRANSVVTEPVYIYVASPKPKPEKVYVSGAGPEARA